MIEKQKKYVTLSLTGIRLLALAVAVLSAAPATAQEGSITGRVTDGATSQSLRGAQVCSWSEPRGEF